MAEDPTTLINALAGGAASNAPATLLLAYLIKQIREWKTATITDAKADATHAAEILILKHELKRSQDDHQECRARLVRIESQLDAVWRKIGSRPTDRHRDESGD